MGVKAEETVTFDNYDVFVNDLRAKTRIFMEYDGNEYYLTHTDGYWRAQDCSKLNDKQHFTDCSELVTTLAEFLELPWLAGDKSVKDVYADARFFESIQE